MAIYPPIEPPITNARFEGTRLFTASAIASIAARVRVRWCVCGGVCGCVCGVSLPQAWRRAAQRAYQSPWSASRGTGRRVRACRAKWRSTRATHAATGQQNCDSRNASNGESKWPSLCTCASAGPRRAQFLRVPDAPWIITIACCGDKHEQVSACRVVCRVALSGAYGIFGVAPGVVGAGVLDRGEAAEARLAQSLDRVVLQLRGREQPPVRAPATSIAPLQEKDTTLARDTQHAQHNTTWHTTRHTTVRVTKDVAAAAAVVSAQEEAEGRLAAVARRLLRVRHPSRPHRGRQHCGVVSILLTCLPLVRWRSFTVSCWQMNRRRRWLPLRLTSSSTGKGWSDSVARPECAGA